VDQLIQENRDTMRGGRAGKRPQGPAGNGPAAIRHQQALVLDQEVMERHRPKVRRTAQIHGTVAYLPAVGDTAALAADPGSNPLI
jgi:hypothetical protein